MAHRHRPTWAASPGQSRRLRPPGDRGGPGARRARHPHPGRRGDHAGCRRAAVEPGQDRAPSRTGAQPIPLRVRHQPTRSGVGPDGRGAAGPGEGRRRTPPGTQVGAGEHRGGDPRGRSGRGGGVLGWRWQRSGPRPARNRNDLRERRDDGAHQRHRWNADHAGPGQSISRFILRRPNIEYRAAPRRSAQVLGYLPYNSPVYIVCTATGDPVTGPGRAGSAPITTRVWDRVRTERDGDDLGFVPDAWVKTGTTRPVARAC